MATTKIWPVKTSLAKLIGYAANPEKTRLEDLEDVLKYASNDEKTELFAPGETHFLTTTLNCEPYADDPYKAMRMTHSHFNARGDNIAYHAYQSFKPGEVTPEKCHAIGVELAKELWGKKFQVMISSHMNCEHLHNHFVILATSFRDGKKLDTGNNYWKRVLAPTSDRICRENGLSVIENSQKAPPRQIYFAEKNGEPTKYNLMRQAIRAALKLATNQKEFKQILREQGYDIDLDSGRKHLRIKSHFAKQWTRLERLGEDYTLDTFDEYLCWNDCQGMERYDLRQENYRRQNGIYIPGDWRVRNSLDVYPGKLDTLGKLLYVVRVICGWLPEQRGQPYTPLSPEMKEEMRDAAKKCEMYSRSAIILSREHLDTAPQCLDYMAANEKRIKELTKERKKLYYEISKAGKDDLYPLQQKLGMINSEIALRRRENKDLTNVLERSELLPEMIQAEMQMRREKRQRDFMPEVTEKAHPIQEPAYRYEPVPTRKKSRDRDER